MLLSRGWGIILNMNTTDIERSLITSYKKAIYGPFVKAVKEYRLIEDGDRIAVCISGGKDSMVMAKCMQELKRHGKDNFDVRYLVMDPGYNEANLRKIYENAEKMGIPIEVFQSDIFKVAYNSGGSPCYLCARMRRGCLYSKAKELGCNKIALGHHFDDVIETVMMSILYNGQIRSMMPKLKSTNFAGMELIRPLYRVKEQDIINFSRHIGVDFLRCACKFTEKDETAGDGKRAEMKRLIKKLKETNPQADFNIFTATHNVNIDTVVGCRKNGVLHSFLETYDD